MLADHLGPGDYMVTGTVCTLILILAGVIAVWSAFALRRWPRVVGLGLAALLAFAGIRILFRWDQVTGAVDLMTGPAGGEFQLSELDNLAREAFGGAIGVWALWALLLALITLAIHDRRTAS